MASHPTKSQHVIFFLISASVHGSVFSGVGNSLGTEIISCEMTFFFVDVNVEADFLTVASINYRYLSL